MDSSLKLRTVSGIVFVLVMLGCLLFSPYLYAALIIYMMVGMMHEFYAMTMGDIFKVPRILAIASGIIFFALLFCFFSYRIPAKLISLGMIPVTATMLSLLFDKDRKGRLKDFSHIFTGLVYIAVPLSLSTFIALKDGSFSCILLICFFVIIWCSDIGAYTIGMSFGRKEDSRKLCPDISPKKTWIGFWGGMAFSIIAAIVLKLTGLLDIHWLHCIALAVMMHVAGVLGDLFESAWKRACGVKDSGRAIPGHGGLLDRFDSTWMAVPVGTIYLALFNLL
ncbi:MAG: phosphatidate cytidylyltransferase [Bacteroidales bacterium]|nr:phosphatidate cytidylyltransferase [Bacteroidales bacterium]